MSLEFSSLPDIPQWTPEALTKVSNNIDSNSSDNIRNIREVLATIQAGNSQEITPLEWVSCIHSKNLWDTENQNVAEQTSQEIWEVAIENELLEYLQQNLLWRLAIYHSGQQNVLASSLAECFSTFVAPRLRIRKPLTIQILEALRSNIPSQELARLACQHLVIPEQLLSQANLPTWIQPSNEALNYVVEQFSILQSPQNAQVDWLLNCLNQMGIEQRLNAVNNLLTLIPTEIGGKLPKLVEWLRNSYRSGDLWDKLSESARRALRDWIGAVNYGHFKELAQQIINTLLLQTKAQKQLKSRQEFWGNYSNRFKRIRILLPQDSSNLIGTRLRLDVDILEQDGSDPTEVCIFDFGDWFVVEFFRGGGSETRLFPKSAEIENQLFGSSSLSVKRIRFLGGETHDHVFCWQVYCERWLRKRGITANDGTSYFKGLPHEYARYNSNTGLADPSWSSQQQRQPQLNSWEILIRRLEREAREYCSGI